MTSKANWPLARSALLAASLTMTLAGCAGSTPAKVEVRRDLPQSPSWAIPVTVPAPKAGDDPLMVAGRERAGRGDANRRIVALRDWYEAVRADYAGEGVK